MVGMARVELATFWPPVKRANQTALHPDVQSELYYYIAFFVKYNSKTQERSNFLTECRNDAPKNVPAKCMRWKTGWMGNFAGKREKIRRNMGTGGIDRIVLRKTPCHPLSNALRAGELSRSSTRLNSGISFGLFLCINFRTSCCGFCPQWVKKHKNKQNQVL